MNISKEARDIHYSALVVDTHSDSLAWPTRHDVDIGQRQEETHMDLPRMRGGEPERPVLRVLRLAGLDRKEKGRAGDSRLHGLVPHAHAELPRADRAGHDGGRRAAHYRRRKASRHPVHRGRTLHRRRPVHPANVPSPRRTIHDAHMEQHQQLGRRRARRASSRRTEPLRQGRWCGR